MTFLPFLRAQLKNWLWSFFAFSLLAFLVVGQFAWRTSLPWTDALQIAARDWGLWALLTPLIFLLVARLPIQRSNWRFSLPVHFLCGVATIALCNWWSEGIFPPRHGPGSFPQNRGGGEALPDGPGPHRHPGPSVEHRLGGDPHSDLPHGRNGRPGPRRGPPFSPIFFLGFGLPTYLAVVGIAHASYFYRRAQERDRLEASLAKARLETLKMQLQPHFLFNSLNAIVTLVHLNPDAAEEMIGALSNLLRLTLESSSEQELPLRRELEFVERYLAIEHVRFGDRLRFTLEVEDETRNALTPTFLLQPLVENAVRHGLEPRAGDGALTIRARREGQMLHLAVIDNGVGLAGGQPSREGIGLSNTRARLRELYGDDASLELRDSNGLTVEIRLPFRTV